MVLKTHIGYNPRFLGRSYYLPLPKLSAEQKQDLIKFEGKKFKLDYIHYSVVMCKSRRLAYYTAVNIDGSCWQNNPREGSWKEEKRIATHEQLGNKLYRAENSKFDKGHLVRREDPEWGDKEISLKAGAQTFIFTNCAPQHEKLNRDIWADLEANILHAGADQLNVKVSVFTGPVLKASDGSFVTAIDKQYIQIPNLYWKVVVWKKSDNKTYAVGFLQSQEAFLIEDAIIRKPLPVSSKLLCKMTDDDFFEHIEFKDGNIYQVRLEEIENLSGLKFDWQEVKRPFNQKPVAIIGQKRHPSDDTMPLKILRQDAKSQDVCIFRWNPIYQLEGLVI